MSTTLNKLEYLDETKKEIKNALNTNFNSGITDEDTFRSYVGKINDIYTNWAKVTGEGTEITLNNTKKGKMALTPKGNTEQTTYTGKNLLNIANLTATTKNGITLTKNNDGTITLNGTASADANFVFAIDSIVASSSYKAQLYKKGGSFTNNYVSIYMSVDSAFSDFDLLSLTSDSMISMSLGNKTYTYSQIKINSGVVCNNLVVGCQIVNDASITDFEPYVGGTPSPNPDYPQDVRVVTGNNSVKVVGKNLYNLEEYPLIRNRAYTGSTGALQNWGEYSGIDVYFPVEPNTTYSFSNSLNLPIYYGLVYYDNNKTFISGISSETTTFTTPNNCYFIRYAIKSTILPTWVQFEKRNQATSYEPYHNQTYPINLGNIELCKIGDYQDYIYKSNGKWYKHSEIGKVVLDGSEDWSFRTNIGFLIPSDRTTFSLRNINVYDGYCDKFKVQKNNSTWTYKYYCGWNSTGAFWIRDDYSIANNVDDFKNWLSTHNTIVYYVLATPTNTEITDTTLISQLEAIENAVSYDTQTNISSEYVENNAQMIISASALEKGGI